MPCVDDSFLKSLVLGRSSSLLLNPFFPFLYYRSLRFEACRWSKFSNQRDASYWTFQTIPFRISPNFYFFFIRSRDLSKTRASYRAWPHNFSAIRSLDKCHVSDTLKKKLPIFTMAFRHRACPNESRWSEPVDLFIDSKFFSISCRGNRTVSVEQSC